MIKKAEGFIGQRSCVLPRELLQQYASHPLCEGLFITDIGYYPNAAFHTRDRKNGSAQHILIYCVKGEGWYELFGQKYEVKPNQVFLLPANIAHSYGTNSNNPWTIYWVHFAGTRASVYLNFLQTPDSYSPLTVSPQEERIQLFDDILANVERYTKLENIIYANSSLARFLVTFNTTIYNPNPSNGTEDDAINRTISFMKSNLAKSLTLKELAEIAGLSVSHYSAVFRKKVDNSPIGFFTFLKIQEACRLLENTQLRSKEIAYQTGYADPYHFSRVFTNIMGVSPREFRKLRKI